MLTPIQLLKLKDKDIEISNLDNNRRLFWDLDSRQWVVYEEEEMVCLDKKWDTAVDFLLGKR